MALAISAGTGCLGDPSGPFGHQLVLTPESLAFEALGDSARISATQVGPGGTTLPTPAIEYSSAAPAVATIDSTGLVISRGNGATWIIARTPAGETDSIPVAVLQQPSAVVASADTLRFHSLGLQRPLEARVVDRLGAPISGLVLAYAVLDTSIAGITPDGRVDARRNGVTFARAQGAGESLSVVIHVEQQPVRVVTASDTLRFTAFGETVTAAALALDSMGYPVPEARVAELAVVDSTVLEVVDSVTLRAKQNGHTMVQFSVGGLAVVEQGVVAQVPDTIVATLPDTQPILSLGQNSVIPLQCRVLDRNGYPVAVDAVVSPSPGGQWSGSTCQDLRALRSGFDTMLIQVGTVLTRLSVVIAIRPAVSNVHALPLDSMPSGSGPWAPTARRNSLGRLEVYATGYVVDSLTGAFRGHLHRYTSIDGVNFEYDGIALQRDDSLCAPTGSGIENVAVIPRADGPGWRMLYAGGSFECYGWQVFSAVSTDERNWTKEPGVRISNGLPLSEPRGTVPWPAGEGMVVDQLVSGEWRMIVATYEPLQPAENKFQITEWRSPDQLTWTYLRTVFSTRQMPAEGQRSVYSPAIRQVVPGMWRMIFTGDDLNTPGGHSRLWSAVSTDEINWQLEGALLDSEGYDFYYSTLVDDQLVFLQAEPGLVHRMAAATVSMP